MAQVKRGTGARARRGKRWQGKCFMPAWPPLPPPVPSQLSTFLNEQEAKATLQVVLMVQAEERIMTLGPQYEEQIG